MLLGVFFNIALLSFANNNQCFKTVKNIWGKIMNILLDPSQQNFNLCIWSTFLIMFILGVVLIFKRIHYAKQKLIIVAFIISIVNPLLIRYLLCAIIRSDSSSSAILFKIVCLFSILVSLVLHTFIQLVSCSANMQNENLMIHYHNNKLLLK